MPNPVVHFEVMGKDVARLQQFYSDLFGWSIRGSADFDNYGTVEDQESPTPHRQKQGHMQQIKWEGHLTKEPRDPATEPAFGPGPPFHH